MVYISHLCAKDIVTHTVIFVKRISYQSIKRKNNDHVTI